MSRPTKATSLPSAGTFGIQAAGRLPNAVDPAELERLAHADNAVDWRQRLNVPADGRLVAFVGRLIPEKGALRLAQAVQGIPGCSLAVAGTGPEEAALAALSGGIHALGALPHEQIVQLLTQADAYCLPTEYAEGFPTTLLEAAACRCPIVTTRTAGTDELLPGDDYAVFLANAAPETIRAGLETLLADPAAARTRAENARQNLCSHFTWQAVFATMMDAERFQPAADIPGDTVERESAAADAAAGRVLIRLAQRPGQPAVQHIAGGVVDDQRRDAAPLTLPCGPDALRVHPGLDDRKVDALCPEVVCIGKRL